MPSYDRIRTSGALGTGIMSIGDALMAIAQDRQRKEGVQEDREYRKLGVGMDQSRDRYNRERDTLEDDRRTEEETYNRNRERDELEAGGFGVTSPVIPETPDNGKMGKALESVSSLPTFDVGAYDPENDVSVQRARASRAPVDPRWQLETRNGSSFRVNPDTGAVEPIADLPVEAEAGNESDPIAYRQRLMAAANAVQEARAPRDQVVAPGNADEAARTFGFPNAAAVERAMSSLGGGTGSFRPTVDFGFTTGGEMQTGGTTDSTVPGSGRAGGPPAMTEAQRDWDALAAQFGVEVTTSRIGPRP